ncbi:uncharacterized protein BJ171DRAFT_157241 [Polychytrium aggregatum]|uniref:uncharacterized protein n=1 Tax=Polychytrium aggregatum TaxID=110093 RepID=UPI0022FECA60|nr:uncharacterized protein BJ171DRAFT_157241 [Polychytrium aggregatum]KAI9202959.1 hypothetical protein BJ171DRAFT_157241 [Polychytrium aggregatum]
MSADPHQRPVAEPLHSSPMLAAVPESMSAEPSPAPSGSPQPAGFPLAPHHPAPVRDQDQDDQDDQDTSSAPPPSKSWGWGFVNIANNLASDPISFLSSAASTAVNSASSAVNTVSEALMEPTDLISSVTELTKEAKNKAVALGKEIRSATTKAVESLDKEFSMDSSRDDRALYPDADASPVEAEERAQEKQAESLLIQMDKTLDMAASAVGQTIMTGYRKIGESHLVKDVRESETLQQGLEIGQQAVSQGLQTLEYFGAKALSALMDIGSPTEVSPSNPVGESKSIEQLFEEQGGGVRLQALDLLSVEATERLSKLPVSDDEVVNNVQATLNQSVILSEALSRKGSLFTSPDHLTRWAVVVGRLGHESDKIMKDIQDISISASGFQADKLAVYNKDLETLASSGEPLCQAMIDAVNNAYQTSARSKAQMTEKACEQILRISELILMRIRHLEAKEAASADSSKQPPVLEIAKMLKNMTVAFIAELHYYNSIYTQFLETLSIGVPERLGDPMQVSLVHDLIGTRTNVMLSDSDALIRYLQSATQGTVPIVLLLHRTLAAASE